MLERPHTERDLAIWLSPDDVGRLVEAALTGPVEGHLVVWGVSRNTRAWWSQDAARALGYEAQDDSEVSPPTCCASVPPPGAARATPRTCARSEGR